MIEKYFARMNSSGLKRGVRLLNSRSPWRSILDKYHLMENFIKVKGFGWLKKLKYYNIGNN